MKKFLILGSIFLFTQQTLASDNIVKTAYLKAKCSINEESCRIEISKALLTNDLEKIEDYLQVGVSPDLMFNEYNTLIDHAAYIDNQKAVDLFIQYGATVTDRVFFYGVKNKDLSVVKKYFLNDNLRQGRNVDSYDFCYHIDNFHVDTVRFFISEGVPLEPTDKLAESPLLCSAGSIVPRASWGEVSKREAQTTIAKLLIENGADVNYIRHTQPNWDYIHTPLTAAINSENFKVAKILIANGADTNLMTPTGETPLTVAVRQDFWYAKNYVKLLVENGADVNLPNRYGHTPLMITKDNPYRKAEARILLENGAGQSHKEETINEIAR